MAVVNGQPGGIIPATQNEHGIIWPSTLRMTANYGLGPKVRREGDMGEMFAGLGLFGLLFAAVIGLLLFIAPLGIWSAINKSNRLLEEQNLRLKHISEHNIQTHGSLAQIQKMIYEVVNK
jgi:hypothetical protein